MWASRSYSRISQLESSTHRARSLRKPPIAHNNKERLRERDISIVYIYIYVMCVAKCVGFILYTHRGVPNSLGAAAKRALLGSRVLSYIDIYISIIEGEMEDSSRTTFAR